MARTTSEPSRFAVLAIVIAPFTAVAVAAATTTAREELAVANVALVLAAITVAAALISWPAGVATSLAAALSLNYLHTEPLHSLRINSGADLLSVSLLGALGIGVATATALRVRRTVVVRQVTGAARVADQLGASLSTLRPALELWHGAIDTATAQLAMVDARLERSGTSGLPVVARRHVRPGDRPAEEPTVTIPEGGAVVQFADPRHSEQLVLVPRHGLGPIAVDRRLVLAFADHLELALEGRLGRVDASD